MEKLFSLIGIFGFVGIAFAFSQHKKRIDWKLVGIGIALQFVFALVVLKTEAGKKFFEWVNHAVESLLGFTNVGSTFIFGAKVMDPSNLGFVFAVQVLPTIVFFSALMSVAYHLGIMQFVVNILSKLMVKLLGTSGAETLSATANIFVGQTEAPLLIKPYVDKMTRSELMVVMTGGFATVAGGVLAAYVALLSPHFPGIAGHLMAASIMSAPAALVMAKILVPETEEPATKGAVKIEVESKDSNAIEAAANGASEGFTLAMNVGAMLLAFIALIAMFDGILGGIGGWLGYPGFGLKTITSYLFAPLALLMGVPSADILVVGDLLGKKLVINEFVAYSELAAMLGAGAEAEHQLSGRSVVILTYALCGFANFSSIGIQIGGIGSIAPKRKGDLAQLGLIAVLGGTLACFQTATIAGVLIDEDEVQLLQSQKPAITQPGESATPPPPGVTPTPEATASAGVAPTPAPEATASPQAMLQNTSGKLSPVIPGYTGNDIFTKPSV